MPDLINIKFPLEDDSENGFLFKGTKTTANAVKSDLILLLTTKKGERWYNPDYGTNLITYLFEPNDTITHDDIINDLKQAVSNYLSFIKINNVNFIDSTQDSSVNENEININIKYEINQENFYENDELTISFSG